jgi:hypothetical protein
VKTIEKTQVGRPEFREDTLKIDFQDVCCEGVDWIHLDLDGDQ